MNQFRAMAVFIVRRGGLSAALCVMVAMVGCSAVSPSSDSTKTNAQFMREATDNNGTIWPGVFIGLLPDGRQIQLGFNTNDHRVYWDTETWDYGAADWTVK